MSLRELLRSPHISYGLSIRDYEQKSWSPGDMRGRLCELSGIGSTAILTAAMDVAFQVQREHGVVAWLTFAASSFYPPDAHDNGVDLNALVILRLPGVKAMLRAADRLIRSGGFSLLLIDLNAHGYLPLAAGGRLLSLVQKNECSIVFLTEKRSEEGSLGSMISLRSEAKRSHVGVNDFRCEIRSLKDKRKQVGEAVPIFEGALGGPPGLY